MTTVEPPPPGARAWAPVNRAALNRTTPPAPRPQAAPIPTVSEPHLPSLDALPPLPDLLPTQASEPSPAVAATPQVAATLPEAPVPAAPAPVRESAPAPAGQPDPAAAVVTATPVAQKELDKPLSELVPRRDAQEFREVFRDLVNLGISDVHMTRSVLEDSFTVHARLDGVMHLVHTYTGSQAQTIATLIKTESKMSSGINLVPEDGNYELPMDGYPYRARAVAIPLFDGGERIVFRLPQIGDVRALDDLGFTPENLAATKGLLDIPGGMTVFAGPTGEGKSTTSLGALKYLREKDDGVFITLEDPVERVVAGVAQIEVKEEVEGAGFGEMMKYLVRADPNVLFIGEIRDSATATAAVEIAKSGVRLIATIHATNNVSAFLRLMEMADTSPLSVLESVNGIVSQRLVRRLIHGTPRFSGRYPIHEVTKNSEALIDALMANSSRAEITAAAATTSTTFKQNIDALVRAGITTHEEARKVVSDVRN